MPGGIVNRSTRVQGTGEAAAEGAAGTRAGPRGVRGLLVGESTKMALHDGSL